MHLSRKLTNQKRHFIDFSHLLRDVLFCFIWTFPHIKRLSLCRICSKGVTPAAIFSFDPRIWSLYVSLLSLYLVFQQAEADKKFICTASTEWLQYDEGLSVSLLTASFEPHVNEDFKSTGIQRQRRNIKGDSKHGTYVYPSWRKPWNTLRPEISDANKADCRYVQRHIKRSRLL